VRRLALRHFPQAAPVPCFAAGSDLPLLPERHVFVRPGGHGWAVWTPVAGEIFARIREEDGATARAR